MRNSRKNMKNGPVCQCCNKIASFGARNSPVRSATRCKTHKKRGQVNLRTTKCQLCNRTASYGQGSREFCATHRRANDTDQVNAQCNRCHRVRASALYNQMCYGCYMEANPNLQIVRQPGKKEHKIITYIIPHIPPGYPITLNKQVAGTRYRPDLAVTFNRFTWILEINEHQHCRIPNTQEMNRLRKIQRSIARPIVVTRWNPDRYCEDALTIDGVFVRQPDGTLKLRRSEWVRRSSALRDELSEVIRKYHYGKRRPPAIEVTKLFYSQC